MATHQEFIRKKKGFEELPEYYITIDEDDPKSGIKFVSLVIDPATEIKGMYFAKEDLQNMEFKTVKEQMKIVGPAMIPNKRILRKNDDGQMYNVIFTEVEIKKLMQKFNRENNNKAINVDHTNKMANCYIEQNWITEDPVYDKSKLYGYTLAPGTWFIEVKVEDPKFWEECKEVGRYSFSIEGMLGMHPERMASINFPQTPNYIDQIGDKDLVEIIREIIPYRMSYDFDGVLSTEKGQKMASNEIKNGNIVFVVTKRNAITQSKEVYEISDKLGIPREQVIFTNRVLKYRTLRNLNIDIHFDDQDIELFKINKLTNVLGKKFTN